MSKRTIVDPKARADIKEHVDGCAQAWQANANALVRLTTKIESMDFKVDVICWAMGFLTAFTLALFGAILAGAVG